MKYFIDDKNGLHAFENDVTNIPQGLIPCPSRPSEFHIWKDGSWIENTQAKNYNMKEKINAPIRAKLQVIDAKTIRALRTNDTARLASLEADAAALRAQLK